MADSNLEVVETLRKIKKHLECPICLELLSDPFTTQCGHSFCRQCIHTFIASTKLTKCPLCKVPITRRSMNKSACLGDIIDSVRHLEEAVQKDIGVADTPPRTTLHSHECSATPGLIIHSLLHPTPFKPTSMPQASNVAERSTSPVIQRKTRSNVKKTNRRQKKSQKNTTRKANTTDDVTSSSAVPVTACMPDDQPSTSSNMMSSLHNHDVPDDVVTNMATVASITPSSPVKDCSKRLRDQVAGNDCGTEQHDAVEKQDMLSIALFTSSSSIPNNAVALDSNTTLPVTLPQDKLYDNLFEEESPTPVHQQEVPMCCSTPDKSECEPSHTRDMSRSPSIPLQNTPAKMPIVNVTPVALPQRMIALEGLFPEDLTDSDHSHDSLDLFDDIAIPSNQSKDDQDLTITSPALFTADQQSSMTSDHADQQLSITSQHRDQQLSMTSHRVDTAVDTMPSLGDSISTQEIMRLQQELEQKQNEIASLDAVIQEKSIQNVTACSKDDQLSLTLPSSVETIRDSLPTNTAQVQSLTSQSPVTPSTQMNTVALFQCADQILNGLKKTLRKNRALTPIDTNVTKDYSKCVDKDKAFYTPLHHVQATRPYSDQPRHNKLSLSTHKKLNYSVELIPSNVVSLTTSGLSLCEIEKVQRLAEVCSVQYCNRLSSDTTHLVMATTGNDRICTRTPKYLQALLRGLWIVTYDWVAESLKAGVLVDEVDYEVTGDTTCASNVPRRARMAKLRKANEILSSYTVTLIGEMKEIGTRSLTSLILLAGGIPSHKSLTDVIKGYDDRVVVLCDPSGLEDNDLDVIRSNSVSAVSLGWLLDSISCYKMQSFDDYLVK